MAFERIARSELRWSTAPPRALAAFAFTPTELSGRLGCTFERGSDDLDHFQALGLRLPSGRDVLLLWYERAPVKLTSIEVDGADSAEAALREFFAVTGLRRDEIVWWGEFDPGAG